MNWNDRFPSHAAAPFRVTIRDYSICRLQGMVFVTSRVTPITEQAPQLNNGLLLSTWSTWNRSNMAQQHFIYISCTKNRYIDSRPCRYDTAKLATAISIFEYIWYGVPWRMWKCRTNPQEFFGGATAVAVPFFCFQKPEISVLRPQPHSRKSVDSTTLVSFTWLWQPFSFTLASNLKVQWLAIMGHPRGQTWSNKNSGIQLGKQPGRWEYYSLEVNKQWTYQS